MIDVGFEGVASIENLLGAWKEFVRGKRMRQDVADFGARLMENLFSLRDDLANRTYAHGAYQAFAVSDPKPRSIHKAMVRDRIVHHALYRSLYPAFDRLFIADSFSCRKDKGVHRALNRFRAMAYAESANHTRTVWVLKCDIRKFFASIDHALLLGILDRHVADHDIRRLLAEIVRSFSSGMPGVGLPLGNLTSQLLCNIYLNELDWHMKCRLGVKRYVRYADDFVILSRDRGWLTSLIAPMEVFLREKLALSLHPGKVSIKTIDSGVDFLGWVHFPDHRVVRTVTRRRMIRRIAASANEVASAVSYKGLLSHGNAHAIAVRHIFPIVGAMR